MKRRQVYNFDEIEAGFEHMENLLKRNSADAKRKKNQPEFREIQVKRDLLKQYTNEYSEVRDDLMTVFVSMSSRCRNEHCDRIKEIADEIGFSSVVTGFDQDVGDGHDGKLRPEIMTKILKCNGFLGIWSNDFSVGDKDRTIPGVWMPLELGMALTYSKPFDLVFHNSLEQSYLSPIIEFKLENFNDQRSFDAGVKKALTRLYFKIQNSRSVE